MIHWMPATIISLFSFGLWGFFTKLGITYIDARSALIFQTLGVLVIGLFVLSQMQFKPATDLKGVSFGILTGLSYGIGCLFFFSAADKGKVSTIVTLTALYPIVTIILSFLFLRENITLKQLAGISLALAAIFLMAE